MSNKVALVTGASAGMGKEIALKLLSDGLIVHGAARRVDEMQDLADAGVTTHAMDITSEEDVAAVVDAIAAQHGGVDVLINNAGFGLYGPVEEIDIDDARYQFEVNLFGLARLTQLVLPYMREQRSGRIINMSSMGGKIYTPMGAWYHASKHALEGWSDCLRYELHPHGVDVVVIEPGAINTGWGDIARDKMVERFGSGAYADTVIATANTLSGVYQEGGSSPPSVIANVVSRAVRSRRPKLRYAAGKYARTALISRALLPDRVIDAVLRSQYK